MDGSKPLIVILGPTAVGKTGIAIEIAQRINGEIIGADSRQVYRYMDIGTAKPTPAERAAVPHHLIDIVDPDDTISLSVYQAQAYQKIDETHAKQGVPLLVGGTGQYITAVTEGWSIPEVAPNFELRTELEAFGAEHGSPALYERLQQLDPDAAEKIHPNNLRRIIRALEVCIESGERMSDLQQKKPPHYRILELGLTLERQYLYARADHRVDIMIQSGFVDEVRHLLAMGYDRHLPSMSSLGYTQIIRHLLDGISLETAIEETKNATHNFIRRQYTWFHGHDNGILWHNVQQISSETLTELCIGWLHG